MLTTEITRGKFDEVSGCWPTIASAILIHRLLTPLPRLLPFLSH